MEMDLDQYGHERDINGNDYALIKVRVPEALNDLVCIPRAYNDQKRESHPEEKTVWFYIQDGVKYVTFLCEGYEDLEVEIKPQAQSGKVYTMEISVNTSIVIVQNVSDLQDYLKIKVSPEDANLWIGKSKEKKDELINLKLRDGQFSKLLPYGTYYYELTHKLYKTKKGEVRIDGNDANFKIIMSPNYGYVEIDTSPSDADIYIDEIFVGKSPIKTGKLGAGKKEVWIQKTDYYSDKHEISVKGDGTVQNYSFSLRPQFGTVTLECEDPKAEIWIDKEYKSLGCWKGNLSALNGGEHKIETKKKGHQSAGATIIVKEGEQSTKNVKAPTPLYGSINVNTSPRECDIFIDDEFVATSPKNINEILVGEHILTLKKDGYITIRESISVEHNQTLSIEKTLKKGTLYVPVEVRTVSSASIYIDGKYYGKGTYTGKLPEGEHTFCSRETDCTDGLVSKTLKSGNKTVLIRIPAPVQKTGKFKAVGRNNAYVYLKESGGSFTKFGTIPYEGNIPVGEYDAYSSKYGYEDSPVYSFSIEENKLTQLNFKQKKKYWISQEEDFAEHFGEVKYGYGLGSAPDHYLGFNYGYVKSHLGLHTSALFGVGGKDVSAHLGPILRLTNDRSDLDFQIYAGIGAHYDRNATFVDPLFKSKEWHWSADAGIRLNFDNLNDDSAFSWASLSLGCQLSDGMAVPNIGVSLFPKLIDLSGMLDFVGTSEDGFSQHFFDTLMGYDACYSGFMMGLSYTWLKTHLGLYTSFMIGFDGGYSIIAGPAVRLTSDLSSCDFQLYGGCGVVNDCFGCDLGIRFGWHGDNFSLWDFSLGCQVYDGCFIPTISIGPGLIYIIAEALAAMGESFYYY